MALRGQVSEAQATYRDPVFGVNLRVAEQDLVEGQARLMQNCVLDGGTRMREGNTRTTTGSLGVFRIRGGHMFYYGGTALSKKRLVAYDDTVSVIADNGTETKLLETLTSDKDTFFTTWPITDEVYTCNGSDALQKYDGTTWATVTGTAVPTPINDGVVAFLDRLLAITANGIERSDPRIDSIWSTNSAWATFRPTQAGLFTAMKPFALRGADSFIDGVIAFQASAYYLITGGQPGQIIDFGGDVTAATDANDTSRIQLINPNVGTRSPYSVVTVPGIGMFWFTNNLNVYWLPEDQLKGGRYVGDNIRSTGTTTGIEGTNIARLDQVWMEYLHPYLMLGIPLGTDVFASTQWWLDVRSLQDHPERGPVWYGPMVGQTVGRVWAEKQVNDDFLYAGEGNSATGAEVYRLRVPNTFSDSKGAVAANHTMIYQTNFKDFGAPSREKYVRGVHFDLNDFSGTATVDLVDLDGKQITGRAITTI